MKIIFKYSLLFLFFIAPSLLAQTTTYTYDALGRVTYVSDSVNGNRDYDYDKAGNRLLVSVGTANDAAAEPGMSGSGTSLAAPSGLSCYQSNGPTAWKGSWNIVPGADHYVFRLGDNYTSYYTPNEPNGAIRVTGATSPVSTPVMSIPTSTKPCKWVMACDASNNCGPQAYF